MASIPGVPSQSTTRRDDEPYVDPVIEAYKKGVDRTLIAETLRMTVEERFDNLMALQEFALELRRAGQTAVAAAAARP